MHKYERPITKDTVRIMAQLAGMTGLYAFGTDKALLQSRRMALDLACTICNRPHLPCLADKAVQLVSCGDFFICPACRVCFPTSKTG